MSELKTWLADPLPADVAQALERLARTDDVCHVAVMPDVHLAQDVCVGTVAATSRFIYPNAVGGDIGCGMAAVAFDAPADLLADRARAVSLLEGLYRVVPSNRHRQPPVGPLWEALERTPLSDPRLETLRRRDGRVQLGTLGRGNHFLEFQSDEEGRLWLMAHSGSRAIGQAIRDFHLRAAAAANTGLRFLDAEAEQGQAYLADMTWAREYAASSRRAMVDATIQLVAEVLGVGAVADSYIACDHNHVQRESHLGRLLWVHRKGAISAAEGEAGIIPGSMGTWSFHVIGRGCPESLCSSSHGAGRAMSRDQARRTISAHELQRQMRGVWFDNRMAAKLCDEAPTAYKDIGAVFRAQAELTRIIRKLRPILSYKGA